MKQILIAEDDPIQRKILNRALLKNGEHFAIIEVEDGHAAVKALESQPFDLVITDIHMPRAKGFIVLAYLNAFMPHVPCIVMTAYGTARLKAKMPSDLLKFYQKPFDVEDLAAAVLTALEIIPPPSDEQGISLLQFLDIVSSQHGTGTIIVSADARPNCRIYIQNGVLMDAQMMSLYGEEALMEALRWPRATYHFDNDVPPSLTREINLSMETLVRRVGAAPVR
ncbi:MAG: response regulator [Pseudomonadota bacterium]